MVLRRSRDETNGVPVIALVSVFSFGSGVLPFNTHQCRSIPKRIRLHNAPQITHQARLFIFDNWYVDMKCRVVTRHGRVNGSTLR